MIRARFRRVWQPALAAPGLGTGLAGSGHMAEPTADAWDRVEPPSLGVRLLRVDTSDGCRPTLAATIAFCRAVGFQPPAAHL